MKRLLYVLLIVGLVGCAEVGNSTPPTAEEPTITEPTIEEPQTPTIEEQVKGITLECGKLTISSGMFPFVMHDVVVKNDTELEIEAVNFVIHYENENGEILADEISDESEFELTIEGTNTLDVALFANAQATKAVVKITSVKLVSGLVVELQ